jgi:hypothetical protein
MFVQRSPADSVDNINHDEATGFRTRPDINSSTQPGSNLCRQTYRQVKALISLASLISNSDADFSPSDRFSESFTAVCANLKANEFYALPTPFPQFPIESRYGYKAKASPVRYSWAGS